MHGSPHDIDLKFLEKKELVQVCINLHQLILHFDEDVSLTAMTKVVINSSAGEATEIADFSKTPLGFTKLLGKSTVREVHEPNGTLMLTLETGDKLTFVDDQNAYESYVITHGRDIIAV